MKNFGRFTYYGSLAGYPHFWSTTDPPIYGARICLNEVGNTYVALRGEEHTEPTAEEIAEARALVMSKDFGRFKYRGKLGKAEHLWSTGKNLVISGARIALNKDGSIHHISEDPKPTEAEITEARAKIGIEEAQVSQSEWDFGRFKYQGLFDSIHRWFAGDVLNPVAQIWLDTNDGKGVCITDGEDKPATEEEIASAETLVKGSSSDQQSDWDFGRFKYRGKFEIPNSYLSIESRHTWYTSQGSKIGLREDGSLAFTCETHGLEKPTAFEIAKAQALVKHELAEDIPMRTSSKSVRGSSPNIQRMRRTPRERTRIPDFSRLGSVVGSPLIHPHPQNFGRFIYHSNLGTDHFWTTDPDSTDIAYISVNPDGTLNQSGAQGVSFKAPTKEEIYTARNMVLSANLVKQAKKEKWSFGMSEPPVDIGGSIFKHLLKLLTPKEIPPMERAKIDPGPVYLIKPHILSVPLLDPFPHTQHHCLYTERHDVFKISGLAMWGISEDTTLNISIGGRVIFDGDVPAQMFANGLSFHALYQILELKEPPDRIVSQDVPEDLLKKLRLNVKWRELEAGLIPPLKIHDSLELNISGLAKYAVFWGYRRDLIHD